tara:strand:+ start:3760 stop:4293 length:534 start_codon:yes stop_codon:yes gene_type:complete
MIASQLKIIEQGISYLESVSKADYTAIISPNFISSTGSHMRHIIDHYQAIISGLNKELIDYNVRSRGSQFELSPRLAIGKLNEITEWIEQLTEDKLNKLITLATEVSISKQNIQHVQTSVARELVFASSHAVHHYAMIAQISFAQQNSQPQSFGLAPATATFLRQSSNQTNIKQKGC